MKRVLILLSGFILFGLFGCQPKDRITLEPAPGATTWDAIGAETLAAKMANGDDFVLVVSSETCTSCADFKPIVDALITTYGVVVYKIEAGAAFPADNDVFPYTYTPTIAVFKDGFAKASIDPDEQGRPFESLARLVDWLDFYVEFPVIG